MMRAATNVLAVATTGQGGHGVGHLDWGLGRGPVKVPVAVLTGGVLGRRVGRTCWADVLGRRVVQTSALSMRIWGADMLEGWDWGLGRRPLKDAIAVFL